MLQARLAIVPSVVEFDACGLPAPLVAAPPVDEALTAPLALLDATAQGLAIAGVPLRVPLTRVMEAYGYDVSKLVLELTPVWVAALCVA